MIIISVLVVSTVIATRVSRGVDFHTAAGTSSSSAGPDDVSHTHTDAHPNADAITPRLQRSEYSNNKRTF